MADMTHCTIQLLRTQIQKRTLELRMLHAHSADFCTLFHDIARDAEMGVSVSCTVQALVVQHCKTLHKNVSNNKKTTTGFYDYTNPATRYGSNILKKLSFIAGGYTTVKQTVNAEVPLKTDRTCIHTTV